MRPWFFYISHCWWYMCSMLTTQPVLLVFPMQDRTQEKLYMCQEDTCLQEQAPCLKNTCLQEQAVPSSNLTSLEKCRAGHEGVLCSICSDGYVHGHIVQTDRISATTNDLWPGISQVKISKFWWLSLFWNNLTLAAWLNSQMEPHHIGLDLGREPST